jgi:hypothetical protein
VIIPTAINPDLCVLDRPFDDYLSNPVEREDLLTAVDQQCQRPWVPSPHRSERIGGQEPARLSGSN